MAGSVSEKTLASQAKILAKARGYQTAWMAKAIEDDRRQRAVNEFIKIIDRVSNLPVDSDVDLAKALLQHFGSDAPTIENLFDTARALLVAESLRSDRDDER